jgi:hypothetical protein
MVAMLEPVLPPEVRISEADCAVIVRDAQQGPGAGMGEEVVLVDHAYHLGLTEEDPRQRAINACEVVLDRVQEFVAEATGVPWPGGKVMPQPHVTIRAGSLMCRYGSSKDPVLLLSPVPLKSLGINDI